SKIAHYQKKRKFKLGRQTVMTKLGAKSIHTVRVRGGNIKHRALRIKSGNFAWGSECVTKKTQVIGVVYNSTNNELVRTNTFVKGAIIQIDATPFRQWYEAHYGQPVTKKGKASLSHAPKEKSKAVLKKLEQQKATAKIDHTLETQFQAGHLYTSISSGPGQSG
ncbi:uncharacterized protein MELLADRAFT_36395, partial [Melampsora larici-populina 98AG31]